MFSDLEAICLNDGHPRLGGQQRARGHTWDAAEGGFGAHGDPALLWNIRIADD